MLEELEVFVANKAELIQVVVGSVQRKTSAREESKALAGGVDP